jgi:hypothetical protein
MTKTENVTIRPLTPKDFEAWLPIWNNYLWVNRVKMRWIDKVALFKSLTATAQAGALAAEYDGRLVGLVQYGVRRSAFAFETAFCVQNLYIIPDHLHEAERTVLRATLIAQLYDYSWAQHAPIVLWKAAESLLGAEGGAKAEAISPFMTYKKAA